jgi:mono/diheme cytochrome c family protein
MSLNSIYLRFIGLGILTVFLYSCGSTDDVSPTLPEDQATLDLIKQGEGLIANNCYSCHSATAPLEGGRLAPPMEAVKNHYLNKETTLDEFTGQLVRFVNKPSEAYSKMPGARKRFGLMPALPLPTEELKSIAAFIYYKDLEAPAWLEAHQGGEYGVPANQEAYVERGKQQAMQTKAILGKKLMAAVNAGGPENAVAFCNVRAIPLTDSSSNVLRVRRVSDRPRNPANAADSLQLVQMDEIRNDLDQGKTDVFRLVDGKEVFTGYYPITTNAFCLQCHGEKEIDINSATISALEALYPEDHAVGYAANQLRGIWVVTMARD